MALTKAGIILKISEITGIDKKKTAESIEKLIEIIKSTLESGEDVLFSGFGKFCSNEKDKRQGTNPGTGKAMMIPAR